MTLWRLNGTNGPEASTTRWTPSTTGLTPPPSSPTSFPLWSRSYFLAFTFRTWRDFLLRGVPTSSNVNLLLPLKKRFVFLRSIFFIINTQRKKINFYFQCYLISKIKKPKSRSSSNEQTIWKGVHIVKKGADEGSIIIWRKVRILSFTLMVASFT